MLPDVYRESEGGKGCVLVTDLYKTYHLLLFSLFHVAKVQHFSDTTKRFAKYFAFNVSFCYYLTHKHTIMTQIKAEGHALWHILPQHCIKVGTEDSHH